MNPTVIIEIVAVVASALAMYFGQKKLPLR